MQVPVRKPDRQCFFRVPPGEEWRLDTAVSELRDDRETYLVSPELRAGLSSEVTLKKLVTETWLPFFSFLEMLI
jgi:hypothetical protein